MHRSWRLSLYGTVVAFEGQQGAGEETPLLDNLAGGRPVLQQLTERGGG